MKRIDGGGKFSSRKRLFNPVLLGIFGEKANMELEQRFASILGRIYMYVHMCTYLQLRYRGSVCVLYLCRYDQ